MVPKSVQSITYSDARKKIEAIGSSMIELELAPFTQEMPGMKMRFIAIFSKKPSRMDIS